MSKEFLNIDPNKSNITSDLERIKQRILRGVQRPLLSLPYGQERGTRIHESLDTDVQSAISNITLSVRKYINKYYSGITAKVVKVESIEPLNIQFELIIEEE